MSKLKYIPKVKGNKLKGDGRNGRYVDPANQKFGYEPLRREKYYAYLKHKAQCKFRNEDYELTWEDWESLWSDELFSKRGRNKYNLILCRSDWVGVWSLNNCEIVTRDEHFKKKVKYNNEQRNV